MDECARALDKEKREIIDRLKKLGLDKNLSVIHSMARHRALFDKFCQLGGEKVPRFSEALRCTRFNKIIVYFADIYLYTVVDDTLTRKDLRAFIGDVCNVSDIRNVCGCLRAGCTWTDLLRRLSGCAGPSPASAENEGSIAESAAENDGATAYSVSLILVSNTGQRLIFISSGCTVSALCRFMSGVNRVETEYLARKQLFNDDLSINIDRNR